MRSNRPWSLSEGNSSTKSPWQRVRLTAGTVLTGALLAALVGPTGAGIAAAGHGPRAESGRSVDPGTATATFKGSVNPDGRPTTAHFEYGIDQRYRPPGDAGGLYDQSTPNQDVGSGTQYETITAPVSGLIPNAVYHWRLVATNSGGTASGPDQTFTTEEDPAPPAPVLGKSENVTPSGSVFFFVSHRQVPLTEPRQLPTGTLINALRGSAKLVAASGNKGRRYTGAFKSGVFRFSQTRTGADKGMTTLSLVEGAFAGAPSYSTCKAKGAADGASAHTALSARVLQTLHSKVSGRFRTRGRYAAGSVRGTQWSTADRCDGTLISVQLHSVLVSDLIKHISVLVQAGHSYLAKAPK